MLQAQIFPSHSCDEIQSIIISNGGNFLNSLIDNLNELGLPRASVLDPKAGASPAGDEFAIILVDDTNPHSPIDYTNYADFVGSSSCVVVLFCNEHSQFRLTEEIRRNAFVIFEKSVSVEAAKFVLRAAAKEASMRHQLDADFTRFVSGLDNLETAKFEIKTIDEAKKLANILGYAFPDYNNARTGLWELLLNAVEHGNLELGFQEKARLLQSGGYEHELAERSRNPKYSERKVEVVFARKKDGIYCTIKDEGAGFDAEEFSRFSPTRAMVKNGKGIQVARITCFDKVAYNSVGNQVAVFVGVN